MPGARRRTVVIVAGAATIAALSLATAFLWPGLERRYHLEVLRRDLSRFEEMLLSPRAVKREAALEFLRDREGKQALFRLYLEEFDRCQPSLSTRDQLRRLRADPTNQGVLALWQDGVSCQTWTGSTAHASFSIANIATDPRRRSRLLELIDACAGRTFRVPGFEKLEFHVVRATAGAVTPPGWSGAAPYPPGQPSIPDVARHACFFRVTAS